MRIVRAYWSHQSPYCYFVLDRLLALNGQDDVEVELRPVLPGVIRDGSLFAGRAEIERAERVNGSKLPRPNQTVEIKSKSEVSSLRVLCANELCDTLSV